MPQREGSLIGGRYRIVSRLGSGGMGVVWRATDEFLERQVALKEVRLPAGVDATDPGYRRTLREARASARLNHPGIVTVHDVTVEDDLPWIVMELVDGESLADLVARNGPLPAERVAEIARQLLAALGAAHDRGILHRDVKPANVLVAGDRVVLTDFGIAAIEDGTALTETNQLIGSPQYISPERIVGKPAGPAADLWALGVTLHVALTGVSPFQRDDPQVVFAAVLTYEPPPVPGRLSALVGGLLRKDPALRLTAAGANALLAPAPEPNPAPQHPAPDQVIEEPAASASAAPPGQTPPGPTPPGQSPLAPAPRRRGPALGLVALAVAVAAVVVWVALPDPIRGTATGGSPASSSASPSAPSAPPSSPGAEVARGVTVPGSPTFQGMTDRGRIVIGVRDDQPGLGYRNPADGSLGGFDIEIATMVAAGLGFPAQAIEFVPVSAAQREDRISRGEVDLVVGSYLITEQRKQRVGFAGPYLIGGQDLAVRKDVQAITGFDSLPGKKVCSIVGSTDAEMLRQNLADPGEIVQVPSYSQCFERLGTGQVDAVTASDVLLRGYASDDPGNLRVVGRPITAEEYGIGMPRDDGPLRNKVNEILQAAIDDGTWRVIYDRTLGLSGAPAQPPVPRPY